MNAFRRKALAPAVLAVALSQTAGADSRPPSVAACAAVSDVLQRLACYDREVARYTQNSPPIPGAAAVSTPSAVPTPAGPAAPVPAAPAPPASTPATPQAAFRHVVAHVVAIEGGSDNLVLHLDNGQVWRQVKKADATLGLRIGDRVTIDRGLGDSFWLSGPSQAIMQVTLSSS